MANYQTLLVDNKDGVTTITLNRPEKRNAMSPQLHRDMYDCLTDLRYDKDTRVIIITGAGESFCAGQDLKQYFIEMDSQPERVRDEVREKSRQWRNEILRKMPQPVIAQDQRLGVRRRLYRRDGLRYRDCGRRCAIRSVRSQFRPFPRRRSHHRPDGAFAAQARALLCVDRQNHERQRSRAHRLDHQGGAARRSWTKK